MARIKETPTEKIKRLENEIAIEKEKMENAVAKYKEIIKSKEKEIEETKKSVFVDFDNELHNFLFKSGVTSSAQMQDIIDIVKANLSTSNGSQTSAESDNFPL